MANEGLKHLESVLNQKEQTTKKKKNYLKLTMQLVKLKMWLAE